MHFVVAAVGKLRRPQRSKVLAAAGIAESEGNSYQGIQDQLRRDTAILRLCTTSLSIADIGRLLGFQEPSAFHRAFKKWCGVQPGQYRLARTTRTPTSGGTRRCTGGIGSHRFRVPLSRIGRVRVS